MHRCGVVGLKNSQKIFGEVCAKLRHTLPGPNIGFSQRAGGRDQFVGRRQGMVCQPEESVRVPAQALSRMRRPRAKRAHQEDLFIGLSGPVDGKDSTALASASHRWPGTP